MHDGLDVTTVIFAILAVFVVWKLKSVLGTRVDIDRRPGPQPVDKTSQPGNVIRLPGAAERSSAGEREPAADVARNDKGRSAVAAIVAADSKFDSARFVAGVRAAYEIIIEAFARGDQATLSNLLSTEVLGSFANEIDRRQKAGETASTRIVAINDIELIDGAVREGVAQISARISAKLVSVVRNRDGEIVSGDPEVVVSTDDVWTFSRTIASNDPTWRLIATESHQA